MNTSRPIRARIAPLAIRHNYRLAKQHAPHSRAWAVIKANAYGHGQWRAVDALRDVADGFAMLECENAVALREAQEETGILPLTVVVPAIDVDVHEVRPPREAPHLHLDTRYLVVAPAGAHEHANEESLALRWVTESELDTLEPPVDDSTRRLVQRGLSVARSLQGN